MNTIRTTTLQNVMRIVLGLNMLFAGIGHLTFLRAEFQAQVPNWIPFSKDFIVLASGIVELLLGLCMIFWTNQKVLVGIILAIFFVLVFPGNITQYINHTNAFGLNTDQARLFRLFFQPVLVLWALWCSGAITYFRQKRRTDLSR